MKKIIIGLVTFVVIIIALFIGGNMYVNANGIATKDTLYTFANKVSYDEIFKQEGNQIYYYYQPTCTYCDAIKGDMASFYNSIKEETDVTFNIIDMSTEANRAGWYDWNAHYEKYGEDNKDPMSNPNYKYLPKDLKKVKDVTIIGTPTIIYMEDGKVQYYGVGPEDILQFVDDYPTEYK